MPLPTDLTDTEKGTDTPTMELRFVCRMHWTGQHNERCLQQKWIAVSGDGDTYEVWRDVPLENEGAPF